MRHVIVGTAGHIDHGKTALVRALTGIDTDRFKEEKERGITIDIGFANLDLPDGTRVGFVDVPGHERFVKNMLAGIGGIDLVVLVVAADESVMPQTREHLEICSLLRIRHGFTVITKIDAVEADLVDLVELEVRDYLKGSFLEDRPVVRFSAATGEGKDELVRTLQDIAAGVEARDSDDVFRLPVDRCFTMKGFGTVVTGTLVSGSVSIDDAVVLLPAGPLARVRGIQVHGRSEPRAEAGQRTALNLQGVNVSDVERGMVLTLPSLLEPSSVIDCHIELLRSAPAPITRRKRIRFHSGTAEVLGYVRLLGRDRLDPGDSSFAQIRLEKQALVVPGDRFIIRQYSPMVTIGGGRVIEVGAGKHRLKDERVLGRLEKLRTATPAEILMVMIEDRGLAGTDLKSLVSRVGLAPANIRRWLDELHRDGRVRFVSTNPVMVVSERVHREAAARVVSLVEAFHDKNPLEQGVSRETLNRRALGDAPPVVLQSILDRLEAEKKVGTAGEVVHAYGRTAALAPGEVEARDRILAAFAGYGLEVPPPAEVVAKLGLDAGTARNLLQFMIREGSLRKINEGLVIEGGVIEDVVVRLKERKKTEPDLGVGDFKDLTGVSRKYAIPILEYFDRIRVTRRSGNNRLIL